MRSFAPKVLCVADEVAYSFEPLPFSDRMAELTLEGHLVEDPALLGESLLVLGKQLAEFQEDKDRLDVLAIDADGEIVLVELKVSDDFRVTDLQALAYAGAYATRTPDELADTLRRHLDKVAATATAPESTRRSNSASSAASNGVSRDGSAAHDELGGAVPAQQLAAQSVTASPLATIGEAKAKIVEFLGLDAFEEWSPSQQVRIKLVAPRFPRRVLQNVKYLGDVYGMPIEAIAARMYETPKKEMLITFERLLPLPGEEEFDLTLRRREEAKRDANVQRRKRPNVVPVLVDAGELLDGQTLYLAKWVLPKAHQHLYDPTHVAFRITISVTPGSPTKFRWQPDENTPSKELSPSAVAKELYATLLPDKEIGGTPVAALFLLEPGGKTLQDVALDTGVWESPTGTAGDTDEQDSPEVSDTVEG